MKNEWKWNINDLWLELNLLHGNSVGVFLGTRQDILDDFLTLQIIAVLRVYNLQVDCNKNVFNSS